MDLTPVLSGEQIVLARLRREDLPEITRHIQNIELTTYLRGYGISFSQEDEEAWFEGVARSTPSSVLFGIYERSTDRILGAVELRDIDPRAGTAELGIAIYDPATWGLGFGAEATLLMLQYGFFHLNLHNVMLKVFSFNTRAIRSYQNVGFREIGRRSGAVLLGGERYDDVFMEILSDQVDVSGMRAQIRLLT